MSYEQLVNKLAQPGQGKIVMLILDGLGGLPRNEGGGTELESARRPNLNALAARSSLGLTVPVGPGITTGSGPGHLALFGYDPIENEIGRGALEALGVDFDLGPDDLAARGNFCTVNEAGLIIDRRAGRLPTEASQELLQRLRQIRIAGVEFFLEPVKEHRFAFVMRAPGLEDCLSESDPLKTGLPPLAVHALAPGSARAAELINQFIARANQALLGCHPANAITLRGFSKFPRLPGFAEKYGLKAAGIAVNGMYRGVARLAGMEILDVAGFTLADEIATLEQNWGEYDFIYVHFKKTDTCGENGDFEGKVRAIEEFDALLPRVLALNPDVIIIGGDHSSPAVMRSHSWHPVPLLVYSRYARPDCIPQFGERTCLQGSLGVMPAKQLMSVALAHAGRVAKYGA